MMAQDFHRFLAAPARDRRDVFLAAANRLGTPVQNVEKDFWVCWTLEALYNGLPDGGPRLLFKGGTSLSKAFGLIQRFSEDIDVTVFRNDLGQPASVEELEALTGKKRKAKLEAIRMACQAFLTGDLRHRLTELIAGALPADEQPKARVEVDEADSDGQTLLVWYPTLSVPDSGYIRPAVRIESGAKSALDPHRDVTIRPYIADDLDGFDLAVQNVVTIEPSRTLWDKLIIAHGLRRWFDIRGEVRGEGQRITRHYYDLHCLYLSDMGPSALRDQKLAKDCVRHARMFFNRPDLDLASASPGSFSILPASGMMDALKKDYDRMKAMIFGFVPSFEVVMESVSAIDQVINHPEAAN